MNDVTTSSMSKAPSDSELGQNEFWAQQNKGNDKAQNKQSLAWLNEIPGQNGIMSSSTINLQF